MKCAITIYNTIYTIYILYRTILTRHIILCISTSSLLWPGQDPKIICHDVVVLFSDMLWSGLAGHIFLLGRRGSWAERLQVIDLLKTDNHYIYTYILYIHYCYAYIDVMFNIHICIH